jgi:hypothetical protein
MNKCSAILLFLFSVAGCHSVDSDSTVIKGNIQFPPAGKIYFYSFSDSIDIFLENKSVMDSAIIDQNGNYEFKLHLKNSSAFDLVCGKKNLATNLFISPGDKIKIVFSGKENITHVISDGEAAKFNSYLVQYLDTFYRAPSVKDEYYIGTNYMDIQQFTTYSERRKQRQLDFYTDYFKGDVVEREFNNYALNTISYGIAVDRLMYVWKKRMKGENIVVDSSYYNFATTEFLENKDAFNCPAYIRFLNLYIKDIYERMVERGELPIDESERLIPAVEKYNLALQLLNGPSRDAVLCNIIYSDMHNVAAAEPADRKRKQPLDSMLMTFRKKYSLK